MGTTTFDRNRYRMPAQTRKFDGHVYHYYQVGNKAESQKDADRLRKMGNRVRVVPWNRKYAVYYW